MGLIRYWQRQRRRRQSFPAGWELLLESSFAPYHRLPKADLDELRGLIQVLLAEKVFEGCNGQQITDEVRIMIAANAALLLLHRRHDCYPLLGTVLVYPTSFAAPVRHTDHLGIVTETLEERLGESWETGTIVLAWDSLREVCAGRSGGLNVILHEFAHQLDIEEGISDSTLLRHHDVCRDWAGLCKREYTRLRRNRRRGRPQVLDPYGSTSPAECFAVATETFFERPLRLKAHHPELYAELTTIYRQDPAKYWRGGRETRRFQEAG